MTEKQNSICTACGGENGAHRRPDCPVLGEGLVKSIIAFAGRVRPLVKELYLSAGNHEHLRHLISDEFEGYRDLYEDARADGKRRAAQDPQAVKAPLPAHCPECGGEHGEHRRDDCPQRFREGVDKLYEWMAAVKDLIIDLYDRLDDHDQLKQLIAAEYEGDRIFYGW